MKFVYLHGFASSPQSSKARYFQDRFGARGVPLEVPALDAGDFEHLTVSGQLRVIDAATGGDRAVLLGSSLGGYLAALYASLHPDQIDRVVLMAPALRFPSRWREGLPAPVLEEWRRTGRREIFHYGSGGPRNLAWDLMADLERWPDDPEIWQPALILHGIQDPVVPVADSEAYAARHPKVRLVRYDSGHELTDVVGSLWDETALFLEPLPEFGSRSRG
jgi:uncharacterized protein